MLHEEVRDSSPRAVRIVNALQKPATRVVIKFFIYVIRIFAKFEQWFQQVFKKFL